MVRKPNGGLRKKIFINLIKQYNQIKRRSATNADSVTFCNICYNVTDSAKACYLIDNSQYTRINIVLIARFSSDSNMSSKA
jgi:hypothetical protein